MTGRISDLSPGSSPLGRPVVMEGTVLEPATDSDGFLRVELDLQKGYARSCVWTPKAPAPTPGAAVGVLESDNGNLHVVSIWPQ